MSFPFAFSSFFLDSHVFVLNRWLRFHLTGRTRTTLLIAMIVFVPAFLALASLGPPSQVFFSDQISKSCRRPLYGLDYQTHLVSLHVQKHDFSSTYQRNLARQSLHLWSIVQKSSSAESSTMKVLFMLLTCPLTRSEGFSIQLFRHTKQSSLFQRDKQ